MAWGILWGTLQVGTRKLETGSAIEYNTTRVIVNQN